MSHLGNARYSKRDFWRAEGEKFVEPHYRLRKAARIVTACAGERECDLLDLGCGPGTLMRVLPPTIHYYGIDLAIRDPAPNLLESDLIENPIAFGDHRFDIVLAQGLFEYLEDAQERKLAEVAKILKPRGTFVVSYTNFCHRRTELYWQYSNIRASGEFRRSLEQFFIVDRQIPASHNWYHGQPARRLNMALNMHVNVRIPLLSERLAVEYFFVCSSRETSGQR
jgi:SAM-dependent methyltransferase